MQIESMYIAKEDLVYSYLRTACFVTFSRNKVVHCLAKDKCYGQCVPGT